MPHSYDNSAGGRETSHSTSDRDDYEENCGRGGLLPTACGERFIDCVCTLASGHEGAHGCYHCEEAERVGMPAGIRHEPGSNAALQAFQERERLSRAVDELKHSSSDWYQKYMRVADAVAPSSLGPSDLCNQALKTRARAMAAETALERIKTQVERFESEDSYPAQALENIAEILHEWSASNG